MLGILWRFYDFDNVKHADMPSYYILSFSLNNRRALVNRGLCTAFYKKKILFNFLPTFLARTRPYLTHNYVRLLGEITHDSDPTFDSYRHMTWLALDLGISPARLLPFNGKDMPLQNCTFPFIKLPSILLPSHRLTVLMLFFVFTYTRLSSIDRV